MAQKPSIVGAGTDPEASKKLYNDWAQYYERDIRAWGYSAPEQTAALVRKHISSPGALKVLDAGAGDGLSGVALKEVGFEDITGCDIAPDFLQKSRDKGVYTQTDIVDLSKPLKYGDNAFDMCTCVGVLTYVEPSSGVLSEFIRVTKPGGLICYTNRTDKLHGYRHEEAKLIKEGRWEQVYISDPVPYLPNNPEFGDKVKVILHLFRVLGTESFSKASKLEPPPSAPIAPTRCLILLYSYVEDILEKRGPYRVDHLAHWKPLVHSGQCLLGGALDPPEGDCIILKGASVEEVEALAKSDPYVVNGLVLSHSIKAWNVVLGSALG